MTPYSEENQKFTDMAHIAATKQIYPELFMTDNFEIRDTSLSIGEKERIIDGEMAIDKIVYVKKQGLNAPIEFMIQERFRRKEYLKYQDITITEWNHKTDIKSELFKLNAGIFIYGYYDHENNDILDWVAINTLSLLYKIVTKPLPAKVSRNTNYRSGQTFLSFGFDLLDNAGLILARKNNES